MSWPAGRSNAGGNNRAPRGHGYGAAAPGEAGTTIAGESSSRAVASTQFENSSRTGAPAAGSSAPAGGRPKLEEWDWRRFRHVAVLREAARNHGRVELVEDRENGRLVAVKAMPTSWVRESPAAFAAAHPDESELPWVDIAATYHLSSVVQLNCVCEFIGVFHRASAADGNDEMCLVMSYCAGGDLFTWLERSLVGGSGNFSRRENLARLLIRRVVLAVGSVHAQGLAHGDLSLENVLLVEAEEEACPEVARVCLIDFGASTGKVASGVRGKPSYQAPEMHTAKEYDARIADMFSLGVLVFTLVVGDYPWQSTRPHLCQKFIFYGQKGMMPYLSRRKARNDSGEVQPLSSLLSPEVLQLFEGLLCIDPAKRLDVEKALQMAWLQPNLADGSEHGPVANAPPNGRDLPASASTDMHSRRDQLELERAVDAGQNGSSGAQDSPHRSQRNPAT